MRDGELIKISEMAEIHGISRQTLILYDRNGLFKPAYVSETGYRYYSIDQVPQLREIIFLRDIGVPLATIADYMAERSPELLEQVLDERIAAIDADMERLRRQRAFAEQRRRLHGHISTRARNVGVPFFRWFPTRYAIFEPYPDGQMDDTKLHLAVMAAWRRLSSMDIVPSCGIGSIIRTDAVTTDEPLRGAGSIIVLPFDDDGSAQAMDFAQSACSAASRIDPEHLVTIPAGEYVTLYKYAMPYEVGPDVGLLEWLAERGLEPQGDIVDLCLLDLMFHKNGEKDLCRLEVRVGD